MSSDAESTVDAGVIRLLAQASGAIAPQVAIANILTEERAYKAAEFLETSVEGLLSSSIGEQSITDYPSDYWHEREMLKIKARLPLGKKLNPDPRAAFPIGEWNISQATPRISLFAETEFCPELDYVFKTGAGEPIPEANDYNMLCGELVQLDQAYLAFKDVNHFTILDFLVAENLSLIEDFKSLPSIERIVKTANAAESQGALGSPSGANIVRSVCSQIGQRSKELGFNSFDTTAIIWAVSLSDLVGIEVGAAMRDSNVCPLRWSVDNLRLPYPGAPY